MAAKKAKGGKKKGGKKRYARPNKRGSGGNMAPGSKKGRGGDRRPLFLLIAVLNEHAQNHIPKRDAIKHVPSRHNLAEDCVPSVQMRLRR